MARGATVEQMRRGVEERAEQVRERAMEKAKALEPAMDAVGKTSSPVFIGLAGASIITSLILYFRRRKEDAIFVGHWAPTFLILGMFLKMIRARMAD